MALFPPRLNLDKDGQVVSPFQTADGGTLSPGAAVTLASKDPFASPTVDRRSELRRAAALAMDPVRASILC